MAAPSESLLRDRWFSSLPSRLSARLLEIAMPRRAKTGQQICAPGRRFSGMYFLSEGVVHVHSHAVADKDSFVISFEPPLWLGDAGLFDGWHFTHDVYADSACTYLHFSKGRLELLLSEEPLLWKEFGKLQAHKLRLAYFLLDEFSGMTSEMRLARRLLASAAGFGLRSDFSSTVKVRQELLARSLGLVRATVTPILQNWRRRGIVESSYGRITLIDVEQMKAIAGYVDWPEFYRSAFNLPRTPEV